MNNKLNVEGITIANIEDYNKKCLLIKKLINSTYKNSHIKFSQLSNIDLLYVVVDNIVKISIMPDSSWNNIKNDIDEKLKQTLGNRMCEGCKGNIKCLASCNKCKTNICLECYIDNFRIGKGIIKCNFCSYSFGCKVPDEYIDLAIDDIRTNAQMK